MHMQMMTHYSFQLLYRFLFYFQHAFYSLFNETVSTFDHLLNLYHFIRRGLILKKHFHENGSNQLKWMITLSCDMIISKEHMLIVA